METCSPPLAMLENMSTSTGHAWEHVHLHWPCMETCPPPLAMHENMSTFTGHAWKQVHLHWPPDKFTLRVHLTQVRWWPSKKEIAANAVKDEGEEDYAWLVGMETSSDTMKTSMEVTQNNLKPNYHISQLCLSPVSRKTLAISVYSSMIHTRLQKQALPNSRGMDKENALFFAQWIFAGKWLWLEMITSSWVSLRKTKAIFSSVFESYMSKYIKSCKLLMTGKKGIHQRWEVQSGVGAWMCRG